MHGTSNRSLVLPALAAVACLLISGPSTAQVQTSALAFETEGLDLETGTVIELGDPAADDSAVDLHIAANPDRAILAVVFQADGAEIALMPDTPFTYVSSSDVAALTFTADPIDESCDDGDTVVIRTSGGSVYKIGNLLEDPLTGVVVFDYELLQSPQAALSPEEPGGPVRVSADSLLVMADSAVGRELPPGGLSTEALRTITSYIERDLYGVRRTSGNSPDGSALEAANPIQAYSTRFTREGIHVRPVGGGWELGLTLIGWGYGEALRAVAPTPPRADGQRVEYVRGALTEWYVNRDSGLEQGFTLAAPPQGAHGEARLRLEMSLSWPLVAEASGGSVLFRDASGRTRLRYGGLKAWDATRRELAAEMKLAENRLTLEVDDLRAVYPVTIDPTIVNEDAKLLASDGAFFDEFGFSVAVSGDTVVVGAL